MSGKTRNDKIKNQRIKKYLRMAPLEDKIKKKRLTCNGHVTRRLPTRPTRGRLDMNIST